jgi:hypothetical protein
VNADEEAKPINPEGICKTCGAPILWVITPRGKKMPVDREALAPDAEVAKPLIRWRLYQEGKWLRAKKGGYSEVAADLHLSHFVTCPDRLVHSKSHARGRH